MKSDDFTTKEFLLSILSRAGRGKDEVMHILGQEIGSAIAAVLKKPLGELVRTHKLQITMELTPKSGKKTAKHSAHKAARKSRDA